MFGTEPGSYNARAYDAMVVATTVMRQFGADRQSIHDGLAKVRRPAQRAVRHRHLRPGDAPGQPSHPAWTWW